MKSLPLVVNGFPVLQLIPAQGETGGLVVTLTCDVFHPARRTFGICSCCRCMNTCFSGSAGKSRFSNKLCTIRLVFAAAAVAPCWPSERMQVGPRGFVHIERRRCPAVTEVWDALLQVKLRVSHLAVPQLLPHLNFAPHASVTSLLPPKLAELLTTSVIVILWNTCTG